MRELLDFALSLADASGALLRERFRQPFAVETKADQSPVTEVDRAVEALLRARIRERFPEHGILGEEEGGERLDARHVWVLDPIDGTRSFVAGKPLFGTLIALCEEGRPVVGVIDHPAVGERWSGARGERARFQGQDARVRGCPELGQAILATTSPHHFHGASAETFEALRRESRDVVYGTDCYAYGLLASGHVDLVVECGLGTYDWCALVPVVQGAGGRITDWRGEELRLPQSPGESGSPDESGAQVVAAGDRGVHETVLERLVPHAT